MSQLNLVTPWSAELTLDETVDRLGRNPRVRAISHLGSTGTDQWTDASDFDLCVLLAAYPPGCGVEATIVDGRIADVVLIDVDRVEALVHLEAAVAAEAVSEQEWPFVHWLAESRPVFDPAGLAARGRERAVQLIGFEVNADRAWQQTTRSFVTHDLRVNTALLRQADDPDVRVALGMRQMHTFVTAVQAWFTARGVRHEGWKRAIAQVAQSDPGFFAIIERWLAANTLEDRHDIYREAVERALEPIGGPPPAGSVLKLPDQVWIGLDVTVC
jgi:hypothetical protein